MEALDTHARYWPFCAELAVHFDLPEPRVAELLERISESAGWMPGIDPILGYLHFRPGPRLSGAHCGFVRMKRGMRIPVHRHRGRELTYVLEGALEDDAGRVFGPGEIIDMPAGSCHALVIRPEADAVVANLQSGIEMLGI